MEHDKEEVADLILEAHLAGGQRATEKTNASIVHATCGSKDSSCAPSIESSKGAWVELPLDTGVAEAETLGLETAQAVNLLAVARDFQANLENVLAEKLPEGVVFSWELPTA